MCRLCSRLSDVLARSRRASIARNCDPSALRVRRFARRRDELGAFLEQRLERLAGNDISPACKAFLEFDPLIELLEILGELFVEALLVCGFFAPFVRAVARRLAAHRER